MNIQTSHYSGHHTDTAEDHPGQRQQLQAADGMATPAISLTIDDVDAMAREIDELPRVEKFDAKAQLARLGPSLAGMRIKGYELADIRSHLAARGIHASISSISRAINGGVIEKPKGKKTKIAK